MSRPREWIPRLHVQGGSDTKSAGISEHGDGVEVVDATLQKLLLILSRGPLSSRRLSLVWTE